jgi:crossover junction endodeoxyribonuclease RuvC
MKQLDIILGIDPGLHHMGWGVIGFNGLRLSYISSGRITTKTKDPLPQRLAYLYEQLEQVIDTFQPTTSAVEETFVNQNPTSTLKLGFARGVALLAPARLNIPVLSYTANQVKKSVVGAGHAQKNQVMDMVSRLLPQSDIKSADEADALAVAICHTHNLSTHAQLLG